MLSGLSLLQVVGLAVLGGMGLIAIEAIKLILENEYTSWASGLARLLAWLAGRLYKPRRAEWWADLLYVQQVERQTGACKAASWLASAPKLALRHAAATLGSRRTLLYRSAARLLVQLAGLLYPPDQRSWWADLVYVQEMEKQTGVFEAASTLLIAPWLVLGDLLARIRSSRRRGGRR